MRSITRRFRFLVAPLTFALATPTFAIEAATQAPVNTTTGSETAAQATRLEMTDVALSSEGLLVGQVVNKQGKPLPAAEIALHTGHSKPLPGTTNERGQFGYRNVAAGVYYLQTGGQVRIVRAWPEKIAPPSAAKGVLLVHSDQAVRGQYAPPSGVNGFVKNTKRVFTNPFAVAGIVATAIAIPVAIHNADDGS